MNDGSINLLLHPGEESPSDAGVEYLLESHGSGELGGVVDGGKFLWVRVKSFARDLERSTTSKTMNSDGF
jgi:hypothetical protein